MNSEDFISVSEKIVGFGAAGSRSATSRAYYGVFNLTIDIIVELSGIARSKFKRDHKIPQWCLQKSSDENAKEAEDLYGNLQTRRIKADYRIEESDPDSMRFGQYSVAMGRKCQQLLNAFLEACRKDKAIRQEFLTGIDSIFSLKGIPK